MENEPKKIEIGAREIVYLAVLTAVALILHLVESWIPPVLVFAPGVKVGLANAATLFTLIIFGVPAAFFVTAARCLLAALFAGNIFGLAYSLSGGLAALAVMSLFWYFVYPHVSLVSVSILGAVTHNIVQLFVASLLVGQIKVMYLLPWNVIASFIAGIVIGLAVHYTVKALPQKFLTGFRTGTAAVQRPPDEAAKK